MAISARNVDRSTTKQNTNESYISSESTSFDIQQQLIFLISREFDMSIFRNQLITSNNDQYNNLYANNCLLSYYFLNWLFSFETFAKYFPFMCFITCIFFNKGIFKSDLLIPIHYLHCFTWLQAPDSYDKMLFNASKVECKRPVIYQPVGPARSFYQLCVYRYHLL